MSNFLEGRPRRYPILFGKDLKYHIYVRATYYIVQSLFQ